VWHRRQDGRGEGALRALQRRWSRAGARSVDRRLRRVGDDSGLPGSGRHEGKQAAIGVLQEALGANDKKYERPPGNSLNRAIRSSCSGTKKVHMGIGQCVCHSPISGASRRAGL